MVLNENTIIQSTKWSAITETAVKLASPISNIILARLLAPEVFGLVATYTLVTSFAEVFTDGGFQKYLVQHEFTDDEDRKDCTDTAFWTNFFLSMLFWIVIFLFRNGIAEIVGSPGHGKELAVLALQIPLFGLSSIQQALYRRDFRFKDLAPIRLVTSFVPLFVTVPLAFFMRNSWAVILGYIIKEFVNAMLLTLKSSWKPRFFFSILQLRLMFSECLELMADSFMIWLTSYAGTLIISNKLSSYYLGIYRTGYTTITSYLSIIYVITQPVVFSALSRCQNDNKECNRIYIQYLKYVAYLIIPLGAGIFVYHDFVIDILLGSKWNEASIIVAFTGLTYPISMLTGQFNSVYFRAKGKPIVALIVQSAYLVIMVISFVISSSKSFELFCVVAGTVNIFYAIISTIALIKCFHFPFIQLFKQWLPPIFATVVMSIWGIFSIYTFSSNMFAHVISVIISCIVYFTVLAILPSSRKDISLLIKRIGIYEKS